MAGSDSPVEGSGSLYFFPDRSVSEAELQSILKGTDREKKCWAVSCMLHYAQWDDIWGYVSRDEVRALFPELELPDNLRQAWARMLKIEAPVG